MALWTCAAENHGDEWGLAYLLTVSDIYINSNVKSLTKFTNSSRSTEFKDILPWNISQMITKTITISTRIIICYAIKRDTSILTWWKVNGNWDNMIRISRWNESHCRRNTSIRRKKQIQKSWTVRIRVGMLTIWVRSFETFLRWNRSKSHAIKTKKVRLIEEREVRH